MTAFSRTWWGTRFIDALKDFMDEDRLKRGRSYSGPSRILSFEINDTKVSAKIRGNINPYFGVNEEPKYKTSFSFKTIDQETWKKLTKVLTSRAGFITKLMLDEMPGNIEDAFSDLNVALLPKDPEDLKSKCSCPDWANPCKHIAGIYFKVAKELDKDPFLLFQLRGLPKHELEKRLQASPLGKALLAHRNRSNRITIKPQTARFTSVKKVSSTSALNLKTFWGLPAGIAYQNEEASDYACSAVLIKKQGDYPSFWESQNSFV